MFKKVAIGIMLIASTTFAVLAAAAEDPSMHQVYQAAEAGKFNEAQGMMAEVLRDHPNSAKAHFVEAELSAKQGRLVNAQSELNTAERLSPGLPFAKPQSVQNLKNRLAKSTASVGFAPVVNNVQSQATAGPPWGMIFIAIGALLAIMFMIRAMSRNNNSMAPAGGARYAPVSPMQSYGGGGMAAPMGQTGPGIGSGIMGGLATGAAMGAGMVAGEALMHHFTDGDRRDFGSTPPIDNSSWDSTPDDMGGADFGISDNSSWDDDSSGGGGDWDS